MGDCGRGGGGVRNSGWKWWVNVVEVVGERGAKVGVVGDCGRGGGEVRSGGWEWWANVVEVVGEWSSGWEWWVNVVEVVGELGAAGECGGGWTLRVKILELVYV